MIKHDKLGGRTVELFIPFEHAGKPVTSITFAPLRLGHVLQWNEGAWKSMIELMVEMSGVAEGIIRDLRYPDADRVMEAFMSLLTVEIRDDIANGRIPQKPVDTPAAVTREDDETTSGNGQLPPGAPIPPTFAPEQPGFDLSEEP